MTLLAEAAADPTTWQDLVGMGLVFAFIIAMTWICSRWL